VVQAGVGIESLQFQDNGGTCITVKSKKTVIQASAVSSLTQLYFESQELTKVVS
jgi:20S proteasome alpha/beta subunit